MSRAAAESNWRFVELGEICHFISGVTYTAEEAVAKRQDGYLPILRAGNIGEELDLENDLVWVPSGRISAQQFIQANDIVMCMSSGSSDVVGKSALAEQDFNGSAGAFCCIIRPQNTELATYLAFWFKSAEFATWRDAQARGANIQNLRASQLSQIVIPLPPLAEQRRIAAILRAADDDRRRRRYTQTLSDSLLGQVFVRMFGDPATNPLGWCAKQLGDICEIQGGLQLSQARAAYALTLPYLRVANVFRNCLDLSEIKLIGLSLEEAERTRMEAGDLLFVEGHGNIEEVGRCAVWDGSIQNCVHQNHLIRARLMDKGVSLSYLAYYVNSAKGRDYFRERSNTTSGLNTISTSIVNECPVLLPPLELQREFAAIVTDYEQSRRQQQESARQSDHLFATLLHRAFAGEL